LPFISGPGRLSLFSVMPVSKSGCPKQVYYYSFGPRSRCSVGNKPGAETL
jgi:hypothetical protein